MHLPTKAGELQQFLCAVNWMRQSIHEFICITSKLYDALVRAAQRAGSRKKLKLSRSSCGGRLSESEIRSVEAVCAALLRMVPLAHLKATTDLALFTDATQDHWGAVLSLLEPGGVALPLTEQNHGPLVLLSGRFTGSASLWPTIEKEAFAIVEATRRHDYLLLRPKGFRLHTTTATSYTCSTHMPRMVP